MRALSAPQAIVGLILGLAAVGLGGPADAQNDGPQSAMEKLRRGEAAPAQPTYGAGTVDPATLQFDSSKATAPGAGSPSARFAVPQGPAAGGGPEVNALQSRLGEKDSMIGELQGKLSSQEGLIGDLQGELGQKDGMIGDLQGELSSRDGRIASLQSELSRKDGTIGDLQARLASQDGLLGKLESQIAGKDGLIVGLEDKLGAITVTLAGLQSQLIGKDQQILGLEDKLGSLDRVMAEMKVDLADRDGLIGQLSERLNSADSGLEASEQRVAALEQQIADGAARSAALEQERDAALGEARSRDAEITQLGNELWSKKSRAEEAAAEIAALETQRMVFGIAIAAALAFAAIGWLRKPEPASRPPEPA